MAKHRQGLLSEGQIDQAIAASGSLVATQEAIDSASAQAAVCASAAEEEDEAIVALQKQLLALREEKREADRVLTQESQDVTHGDVAELADTYTVLAQLHDWDLKSVSASKVELVRQPLPQSPCACTGLSSGSRMALAPAAHGLHLPRLS